MSAKTVFITSFNPFATRNLLFSDAFGILNSKSDLKLVIFCPDYKKDYFEEIFLKKNAVIEGIKAEVADRQDTLFGYLNRSAISTSTLAIHRKEILLRNKNLFTFIISCLLALIGRSLFIKRVIRFLDFFTINKRKFSVYFDKYNPDLVFATDVFHIDDVHFLAEAKKRRIPTMGMVRSWDNITNKGLFRIKPGSLVVNNLIIKDEAVKYEDIEEENILVVGMPQFDCYSVAPRQSRQDFFRNLGLDSNKKTIFLAPHGKRFYKDDWQLLEIVKCLPYQFIVRLPPNDTVDLSRFPPTPNFFIEHPGKSFNKEIYRDREMNLEDSFQLADELFYSDLVINYGSTIAIDAAFFDKPIIIIAFDGFDGYEKKSYLQSVRRFLDFAHIKKILKTDCCKIARSKEDLVKYIEDYLADPRLDEEGRKRLVADQIGEKDGQAGRRIAGYILKIVGGNL